MKNAGPDGNHGDDAPSWLFAYFVNFCSGSLSHWVIWDLRRRYRRELSCLLFRKSLRSSVKPVGIYYPRPSMLNIP
jgi:hypothetical protein